MKLRAAALAGALLLGAVALPARGHTGADRRPGATQFDLEVQISKPNQPAYDSRVVADRHGNLYAVARKVTPASPDDRLTTAGRTSSWRWTSADGGATWQALTGVAAEADARLAGSVTDVAVDEAGHVYVLDAPLVLRYTSTGRGKVAFDGAGALPVAEPTAFAARGDGVVLVLATDTLYVSHDGGRTFGTQGYAFPGASDCRLAAGPRKAVYASCLDGAGKVLLFASRDDGRTFTRKVVASYDTSMSLVDVPPVAVTKDGTVYVLRGETTDLTHLYLMRSADGGRTWTQRRATDEHRRMTHLALRASPDGRLGAAMYVQDDEGERWFVGAGIFEPDENLLVVSFADHTPVSGRGAAPPQGAPGVTFLPDARLAVTWTVVTQTMPTGADPLLQDVWFVRSQLPGKVDNTPKLSRTPRYEIPPCTVEGQVSAVKDWQQIGGPKFRARSGGAGQDLVAYAVDPYEPRVLYATNGTTLMNSTDGGCRWREVWSLEPAPSDDMPSSAAARVVAVAVPEDRREHRTVFVVLAEANRARVVKSTSGEPGTFVLADDGLPPTGRPGLFRVSGANPDFLYLTVGNLLYASEDGGESWSLRTPPGEVATGEPITALALDPKGPNNLYAVRSGVLVHSRDGGRTWTAPAPPAAMQSAAGEITAVDVFHAEAEAPRVTAWSAPGGSRPATVLRSADDGVTWTTEKGAGLEGSVESAAHGSGADVLVVSTRPANGGDAEVYRRDRRTKTYVALSPVDTTQPFRVSADRRGHPTFYGMGLRALFRYAGDDIEPPPAKDAIDDTAFDDIDPPADAPVVTPATQRVSLLVGEKRTVPFAVELAPVKPRVDVMFLTDTSKSMEHRLPVVRRDLLASLRRLAKDVDLRVGVAQAKTDSEAPVYRRERDVGPFDAAAIAAFEKLDARTGAGLETQLIGLDQIVTGEGMGGCASTSVVGQNDGCLAPPVGTFCEVQPDSPGCAVRPGQQANFRDGAVAIVVHATDTTFRNPEGTPRKSDGSMDIAGVAAKYAAAKILHVGIAADPEGTVDLALMSRLTGAVAPAGGLDCTGDGVADVAQGRAAVCRGAAHLDGVLAALAKARTPLTHVHASLSGDRPEVLDKVTPEEFDHVDHTVAQRLPVRVSVSCAGVAPGRYDVALNVRAHDEPAASFGVVVECVLPGADEERRRPPRPGIVVPPILPPIPPPAVPANPLPNVNVNPNVQTQAQTQVQAQAGAAQQERDQAELALAENDMTDTDSVPAPVVMLAGMLGVSAAAAYSAQRRTQSAPAQARSRR